MNKVFKNLIKNYFSTMIFIGVLYLFYSTNKYYNFFLLKTPSFLGNKISLKDIYLRIICLYAIFLIPFYYFEKTNSKARIIIKYLINKFKNKSLKINLEEKNAILSWLVKGFYTPLLIMWLTINLSTLINKTFFGFKNWEAFSNNFFDFFNVYIFIGVFYLFLFIDTFFFVLGYLLESKYLKNKIKSVEPTLFGWLVTLACYPPFNGSIGKLFGWYSTDYPKFTNHTVHYILTISLLIFFGIYARASVALGLKASNLTNRGIIKKGPYKFVRHPAYISKNIAWFIGTIPAYIIAFSTWNFKMIFLISFSFLARSFIYFLRAITEERHLEKDNDYIKYKKEVKYKFIPKIW